MLSNTLGFQERIDVFVVVLVYMTIPYSIVCDFVLHSIRFIATIDI